MGFEPMNTGFADRRVSHFAIRALLRRTSLECDARRLHLYYAFYAFGCGAVRRYGFTVL